MFKPENALQRDLARRITNAENLDGNKFIRELAIALGLDQDGDLFTACNSLGKEVSVYVNLMEGEIKIIE